MNLVLVIAVVILSIFFITKVFSLKRNILKDLKNRDLNKLEKEIEKRVSNEEISSEDIFNSKKIFETRYRKVKEGFYFSKFNDLFSDLDKSKTGAITEMRYILPKGSITNFKNLDAFSLTKTKKDWIDLRIKDELIYVGFRGKSPIIIDMRNKVIKKEGKMIANLSYPDIYARGLFSVYLNLQFESGRSAKVLMAKNFLNSILKIIPNYRIKIAELDNNLTKEEFLSVFGLVLFFKIKNSLYY